MSDSRKGFRWIFRVYKLFVLGGDYEWKTRKLSLDKDYEFLDVNKDNKLRMTIAREGTVTVKAGYAWDGCTPKFSFLDLLVVGTPDGIHSDRTGKPKAYHASLVHDALYQFLPDLPPGKPLYTRKQADEVFLEILEDAEFVPRKFYYAAVRLFGGLFMNARKHITRQTVGLALEWTRTKSARTKKRKQKS